MNEELKPFNKNVAINNEQVRFSLNASGIGTWEIDPQTRQIFWDDQCRKLMGFAPNDAVVYDQVLENVYPDDISSIQDVIGRSLIIQEEKAATISFRIVDNTTRQVCWMKCQGRGYVDSAGKPHRFAGTLQDVTRERQATSARKEAESRFDLAFNTASLGLVIADENGNILFVNRAYGQMLGYLPEELTDSVYQKITHPGDQARYAACIEQLLRGDIPSFNIEKRDIRRDGGAIWVRMNLTRLPDEQGRGYSVLGIAQDISREVAERRENNRLGQLVRNAPELMACTDQNGHIDFINQYGLDLLGVTAEEATGKSLAYFCPPDEHQRILAEIWPAALASQWAGNLMAWHARSHQRIPMAVQWYPISDPVSGETAGTVLVARDLRLIQTIQRELEGKNQELELALEIGELGTYRIDLQTNTIRCSERAQRWWGLPAQTAVLDDLLSRVVTTDQPKWTNTIDRARQQATGGHHDLTYRVINRDTNEFRYLRSLGQAVYEADQAVTLSGTVQDITPEVLAQLKLEEAEIRLLSAVDLADLGTWQINLASGTLDFSDRVRIWYGFDPTEPISLERSYEPVDLADVVLLERALTAATEPGIDGIYDVEYRIKSAVTGRRRILHAKGRTYYDAYQEAYRVSGTMQDVTEQRQTEMALEMEVQERTEELAATNEEMAAINEELTATNEELASTNEELTETNQDLVRSNENLEQFAYIASHDLLEPLRKIQQFGDLLKTRYSEAPEEEVWYLERMQSAASRMSMLIKDLLAFSRISTRQASALAVSLAQVVQNAQDSLSVAITESKARIDVRELPVIQGDPMQLEQLFQNLLSNAIKFSRVDQQGNWQVPTIQVQGSLVAFDELPAVIKPGRQTKSYYRIDVIDNGVGFEEKYTDRIFQVFQRLHGKNEFAGTGVGLAICQKVVTNHGGTITATSQPGKGAIFSVYLPSML